MSVGLPLMKNVLKTLAKSVLVSSRLTAAALATYTAVQQKKFWIGDDCTDNFKQRINTYLVRKGFCD